MRLCCNYLNGAIAGLENMSDLCTVKISLSKSVSVKASVGVN